MLSPSSSYTPPTPSLRPPSLLGYILAGAGGGLVVIVLLLLFLTSNPAWVLGLLQIPQSTSDRASNQPITVPGGASLEEASVVNVVKAATPAVVSIVITKDVPIIERYFEEAPFGNTPFGPFQFRIPQYRQRGTEKQEVGGGSGFVVSADGLIVTNRHVVSQEGVEYTVFTNEGTKYDAEVLARDPANDVAILKINATKLPFLSFGSSKDLQVGQTAIAIGNALAEFRNTVSVGVISGLSRSITAGDEFGQAEQLEEVIQTDAAINPGNSGGPLLNLQGQVIGVNVAVALGSENIGFALPSDLVKSVVESVQKTGKIVRPFLGVRYVMITPTIKESNKLSVDYGALIVRGETQSDLAVTPGSAADKAGLREGDIILEIDGVKLEKDTTLSSAIRNKQVGDRVRVTVLSQGTTKNVDITLEELPQ